VTDAAAVPLTGPAIVLAEGGALRLRGARGEATLGRGDAAYVTPDERSLEFTGDGIAWIATTGDASPSAP
jgi:mannose-6-phosphate isomerase